jgi:hypothetical protein
MGEPKHDRKFPKVTLENAGEGERAFEARAGSRVVIR